MNISVNYVLHISKEIPVCESIRKSLHDVVYAAGIYHSLAIHINATHTLFHSEPHYQPLRGPHINQLIAKETATARGVEVCITKSRVVVSYVKMSQDFVVSCVCLFVSVSHPSVTTTTCRRN